jgi:hypothetical protein
LPAILKCSLPLSLLTGISLMFGLDWQNFLQRPKNFESQPES